MLRRPRFMCAVGCEKVSTAVGAWTVSSRCRAASSSAQSSCIAEAMLTYSGLAQHKAQLSQQLKPLQAELKKLSDTKHKLESQALRFPDLVATASFLYFAAQTSVLFYWVYFRFDWNLVEPITYLLGYSVTWLSLTSYFVFGKEFTFDNMRTIAAEWKRARLFKKHNFDAVAYQKLEIRVADLERRISQLKEIR